jgi:DNA-binding NarL/FixJ family response regulator
MIWALAPPFPLGRDMLNLHDLHATTNTVDTPDGFSSTNGLSTGLMMIRVLIADDHRLVRNSLRFLIEAAEDMEVIAEAENGQVAVALALDLKPDIVLMDLSMPELDGIGATRKILEKNPDQKILALTSFSDRDRVLDALNAGVKGYLLKDEDPEGLIRGIKAAARGESPLDPRVGSVLLESMGTRAAEVTLLTDREREVLMLVAEGLPNKIIAIRLHITTGTVKAHLGRVFQAIGVTDRTQAALWAQKNGVTRR